MQCSLFAIDDEEHARRRHAPGPRLNRGELRLHLGDKRTGVIGNPTGIADDLYLLIDVLERRVRNHHRAKMHGSQSLVEQARFLLENDEVRCQANNRLRIWLKIATDARKLPHLRWIVAELRYTNDAITEAQGEQSLCDAGRSRNNTPRRTLPERPQRNSEENEPAKPSRC